MPRPRKPIPTPRQHKGAAVVDIYDGPTRRTVTLGPWGSDLARQEYERLLARLRLATGPAPAPAVGTGQPSDLTVAEALVRYTDHIEAYYRTPDGRPTGTAADLKVTLGYLRRLFAHLPLAEFDLRCFKAVRQALVADGRVRNQVNRRAGMVRSFVRWCVAEDLPVAPGVLERLRAVKPLAPGRDGVPDGPARRPADPAAVDRALPFLSPAAAAALQLVRLTGARPSEVLNLTPAEVDQAVSPWEFRPTRHKGSWRGKPRVIYLGPAAQAVLAPWLAKASTPDAFVFSPAREAAERNARRSAARRTKRWPSHLRRNAAKRKGLAARRRPADRYGHRAFATAVRRACQKAGVPPFTPYQLRHLKATELRERFGLEHVRAALGHSVPAMSAHYSVAADRALAAQVASETG